MQNCTACKSFKFRPACQFDTSIPYMMLIHVKMLDDQFKRCIHLVYCIGNVLNRLIVEVENSTACNDWETYRADNCCNIG